MYTCMDVKLTLTIPENIRDAARKAGLSFSTVLRNALVEKLGMLGVEIEGNE